MLSNIHRQGIAVPGDQAWGRLLGLHSRTFHSGKTRIPTSRLSIAEFRNVSNISPTALWPDLCGASPDLLG